MQRRLPTHRGRCAARAWHVACAPAGPAGGTELLNLNRLFHHFTIRAKLGIAFALLALIPLAVVAIVTTVVTVSRLEATASETVTREGRLAHSEVERSLRRLNSDIAFLRDAFVARLLTPAQPSSADLDRTVERFLAQSSLLFRVKVIDAQGRVVYQAGSGTGVEGGSGFYYAWRARNVNERQTVLLPVELRGAATSDASVVPAIAVVASVRDAQGLFRGAVVGEARAAMVFGGLDLVAPTLPGSVTALQDSEGRLLYDSERKRDWSKLLEDRLESFDLSGQRGRLDSTGIQLRIESHLVSATPVDLGPSGGELTLLRAVPFRTVNAPLVSFLSWVAVMGAGILLLVTGLASVAARQFTRPIYQLRSAASRLARSEEIPPLNVNTNDELEDLASDFGRMADILASQRRQLEATVSSQTRQLARTHAELAQILEHSADAIIGLDAFDCVRVWNRGADRLFGYSMQEAVGRNFSSLLLPPGREHRSEQEFLRREIERHGAVANFQTQRWARDGRAIPVSLTQTAIRDDAGSAVGSSVILRDTTLQTTLEQQLRRSERLATMSVLGAGLAHEIGNPLAIIGSRLECMSYELAEEGMPRLQQDVEVLREHTERIVDLTRTLLRFARDTDEPETPVRPLPLASRVGVLLERTLAGRNVRVAISGSEEVAVLGAEHELETVWMNLVLNAADAMPEGGTVTVSVQQDQAGVRLVVADEGMGVPAELRERIFEPFFTTKEPQCGTGLGLAVCRSIVERHHGRIWVEGNGKRGSRFVIDLPIAGELPE